MCREKVHEKKSKHEGSEFSSNLYLVCAVDIATFVIGFHCVFKQFQTSTELRKNRTWDMGQYQFHADSSVPKSIDTCIQ